MSEILEADIKKLLTNTISDDQKLCMSIYIPFVGYPRKEFPRRLSSLVREGLRSKDKIGSLSRAHDRLVEFVVDKVADIPEIEPGLAIFTCFNATALEKREINEGLKPEIFIYPLQSVPQEEVYIGNTFDIDQLVIISPDAFQAVALVIEREKCSVYQLSGNELDKLMEIENLYALEKQPGEYLQKYSPTRTDKAMFGTGSDKLARREVEENKRFLDDIADALDKSNISSPYFIIFHSTKFIDTADLIDELSKSRNKSSFIESETIPDGERDLVLRAADIMSEVKKEELSSALSTAKESFGLYTEDWEEIAEAARQGRIEVLFKVNDIQKEGYVSEDGLVYVNPEDGAKPVGNIAPWIVNSVVEAGGDIWIMEGNGTDIAAKLRYNP